MRYFISAFVIILASPGAASAIERKDHDPTPLFSAMYDFDVCDYCGLISFEVYDGYMRQIRALVAEGDLPPDYVRKTELNATIAAEEEYSNRGLGGFRPWCQRDGKAAAARFIAYRALALQANGPDRR